MVEQPILANLDQLRRIEPKVKKKKNGYFFFDLPKEGENV